MVTCNTPPFRAAVRLNSSVRHLNAAESHPKLFGVAFVAAGVFTVSMIALHPEGLRVPAWVAYLAATVFVVAGSSQLARAFSRPRLAESLSLAILALMLLLELWIAFGSGSRQCSVAAMGASGLVFSHVCRGAFAAGAVLVAAMLLVGLRRWWKHRSDA